LLIIQSEAVNIKMTGDVASNLYINFSQRDRYHLLSQSNNVLWSDNNEGQTLLLLIYKITDQHQKYTHFSF